MMTIRYVFMQGQSHTGSVPNSFKSGNNEFSYPISKTSFDDTSQQLSTLSFGSALTIEKFHAVACLVYE